MLLIDYTSGHPSRKRSKAFVEEVLNLYAAARAVHWKKFVNIVHSIIAPILFIWNQLYCKVIAVL